MTPDLSHRLYRLALHAYPRRFRRRHGDEMVRVFAEGLRDARHAGVRATLAYRTRVAADLFASAVRERLATMKTSSIILPLAAIACGLLTTWVDFHATEVQATLLVFLVTSFALGAAAPRGAWRWALLTAVWLPAIQMLAFALQSHGPTPGHPYLSRLAVLLPALAACLVGAYAGALLRWLIGLGTRAGAPQ